MRHLVIGLGEVGTALQQVLACDGIDRQENKEILPGDYDFIHIAFPYTKSFVRDARAYQRYLNSGGITVVHSTVPLGVTRELGRNAVHSPIRGLHPHLRESIEIFVKLFGGPRAQEAAAEFGKLGITTLSTPQPENTEALKLWSTTQYGRAILEQKEIKEYCDKHGLDFEFVYRTGNATYNLGYQQLKLPKYQRYILTHEDGPIGGHCIIPNARLLKHKLAKWLVRENKKLK